MDSSYDPPRTEERTVYVVTLPQGRNDCVVTTETFNKILTPKDVANPFPEAAVRDLTVAIISLKLTQSNSVYFALNGQAIGIDARQQSRIGCTRLAAQKIDS